MTARTWRSRSPSSRWVSSAEQEAAHCQIKEEEVEGCSGQIEGGGRGGGGERVKQEQEHISGGRGKREEGNQQGAERCF